MLRRRLWPQRALEVELLATTLDNTRKRVKIRLAEVAGEQKPFSTPSVRRSGR
jgi:hypothetical protein